MTGVNSVYNLVYINLVCSFFVEFFLINSSCKKNKKITIVKHGVVVHSM